MVREMFLLVDVPLCKLVKGHEPLELALLNVFSCFFRLQE